MRLITLEMFEAGVSAVLDFYPAEWGGSEGITRAEAKALVSAVLTEMAAASIENKEEIHASLNKEYQQLLEDMNGPMPKSGLF